MAHINLAKFTGRVEWKTERKTREEAFRTVGATCWRDDSGFQSNSESKKNATGKKRKD